MEFRNIDMKIKYILIVCFLISCAKNTKEPQAPIENAQEAFSNVSDVPTMNDATDESAGIETSSPVSEKNNLLHKVLQQLQLELSNIKKNLVVFKVQPNNPNETIVVIPEFKDSDYDEHHFQLNSHIVLVNTTTANITHKYFESYKTNGWESDAVSLSEITIDTAPYNIAKNTRAFGVRVYYYGSSKANPYSNKTISLFIKSGDALKKVLHNYDVMDYGGEWDTDCLGEFIGVKKTLIISEQTNNGYFDIIVKTKITETINYKNEEGDCDDKEEIRSQKETLKFNGEVYK